MSNSATSSTVGALPGTGEETIEELRDDIDQLDREIMELVSHRRATSRRIQHLKLRNGQARTDLSRERDVIANYVLNLGSPIGAPLAHAVLEASKKMA